MITGKNYIGNVLSSIGEKQFQTFNPQKNETNEITYWEASNEEIETAVELASKAYVSFKNATGAQRAAFLNEIADQIEALGDELVKTYCSETGLPEGRAQGERGRTVFQLRSFAALVAQGDWLDATIDTAQPDRQPVPKPDLRKMNVPLGPVVVFGASNFPLAYSTAGGDTASALASGCVNSPMLTAGLSSGLSSDCKIASDACRNRRVGCFSHYKCCRKNRNAEWRVQ